MNGDEELEKLRRELAERTHEVSMLRTAIRACPAGSLIASAPDDIIEEWRVAALGTGQTFNEDGQEYRSEDLPLSRALKGEVVEGDSVVIRDSDGTERWASAHPAPVHDDDETLVAGVVVFPETAQHREAEIAAERFRRMAELSPDFVGVFLPDGLVEYINPAGLEMCGLTEGRAAEMRYEDLYTKDSAALLRDVGVLEAANQGHWRAEVDVRHADGSVIPCSQALMAHQEDTAGFVLSTVMRDLRPMRKLESQLRQSQRLESTGRLAGGIAHDFNNLLTIIDNYAWMVLETLDEADSRRSDLQQVRLASERAAALCAQLLSFARQQIIRPGVLLVSDVVNEMMKLFERTLGEDILIRQEFSTSLWSIKVDRSQLDQVLLNLVVNARQAMPEGGTLTIEAENVVVDEYYASTQADVAVGEYVMLAVSDTGVGMTKEVREQVFEPFFTTRGHDGNGLGLATVFGAVRQNGGHIWLYSEEGKGTTFKIYWPRFCGLAQAKTVRSRVAEHVVKQRTVLVVEDEAALLRVTTRLLESAGFTVLGAKDGPTALDVAAGFDGKIDLLLTDFVMPHMNGKQLASRLAESRPDICILYVSGYTQNT
ncbi:MAG: two-component system cell cycle sensor histidine kinase/response regulator CckA, partial [Polyangiales bacterium]